VQRELIHVALFNATITEKGGRRRREEGSLPGVEGAGGLIGGARCNWRW